MKGKKSENSWNKSGSKRCKWSTGPFLSKLQSQLLLHSKRCVKCVKPRPLLEENKVKFLLPPFSVVSLLKTRSYGAVIKSDPVIGEMQSMGRSGFEPLTENTMLFHPKYTQRCSKLLGNLFSLHLKAYIFRTSEWPWDRLSIVDAVRRRANHPAPAHFFGGALAQVF